MAWIALGALWMVTRVRRTRRIWSSRPSPPEPTVRSVPFTLFEHERETFGVRHVGDTVVVGPGRIRLLVSLGVPSAVVIGALFVATSGVPPFAIVLALIVAGAAAAIALAGRHEGVTLTPTSLSVQGRTGDPRTFEWPEVIDVVVDHRDGHDAGVLHVVGERPIDLPGVVAEDVATKITLITRYRTCVHAR